MARFAADQLGLAFSPKTWFLGHHREDDVNTSISARVVRFEEWLSRRTDLFWLSALAVLGLVIYLPYLGAYPLWDPWEPHYSQVAWEMGERNTWMNPWYRGHDNWWSKPILMLWMLRASFGALWDPIGNFADVEMAARLPFALSAVCGALLQYHWSSKLFGRRIAVLAGVILMTAPQYLLIGRQVMVDMPFVAAYAASMGYLAVGLFSQREPPPQSSRAGAWWARNYALALFWILQAIATLAKGFVPPALAVLILAGYALITFRWQDYAELTQGRSWIRYALSRGLVATVIAAASLGAAWALKSDVANQLSLYRGLILSSAAAVIFLGVFHDFPLSRHALHLLRRIGAIWGLPLYLALCAPWYGFMTYTHGWPFWNEFIFYHHLGRAAGTIDKPSHPFEYFLRQVGFGLFPWSAFLLGSIWMFAGRVSVRRSIEERRNAFVVLCIALPFLFFSLSGTKFAHYIFPVIPTLSLLVAATLIWLGRHAPQRVPLSETAPPLGETVEGYTETEDSAKPLYLAAGSRGDLVMFAGLSLVGFGILTKDLATEFRWFLRLFLYYYNRATPFEYHPHIELQWIFVPAGIAMAGWFVTRYIGKRTLVPLAGSAIVLACYLGWITMPAMKSTYSFEPFYHAYNSMAAAGEPIGQYNDWQQPARSVIFLFQNRCEHLKSDGQTEAYLRRPGRKFILVDKHRLADLRRLSNRMGVKLYVVFDDHPYGRLVSNEPNPLDQRRAADSILTSLPADATPADAIFDNKIHLVGWKVDPPKARPGESVSVSFYYRALAMLDDDWQIFIHGDGPHQGTHRIHLDHFPVSGLYGTSEWAIGEIIHDRFTLRVPRDYPYDWFILWNGWYRDQERMRLSNAPPNDGQNRVRGPRVDIVRD